MEKIHTDMSGSDIKQSVSIFSAIMGQIRRYAEKSGLKPSFCYYKLVEHADDAVKTEIENFICEQLTGGISCYDSAEMFFHGYLYGILGGIGGYRIHSNREQGNGRPDLLLEPANPRMPAMIIEIKCAKKFGQMEGLLDEALAQIEERDYAAELIDEGYRKIYKYSFCFCKKSCMVKFAQI